MLSNKRILVTGGAGFIGSNLANYLSDANDVIAVDDCYLGDESNLNDAVRFVEADVVDGKFPTDVDVVFHLAALSSLPMHEEQPTRGARVNVEGFINVVEQARDHCDTVVYASTSSIYGTRTTPTAEDDDFSINTAYEASKAARENYAEYYRNYYDLQVIGTRFFSVYQGFGANEGHKGEFANVLSQFAHDIRNGEAPVIYGDGTQTRDFTHVSDVVRALEAVAERGTADIYNIGTGERYSFNTIVELINDALGTDVEPEYVENPIPEDVYVHDTCADITRITEDTGWEPEITLEDGIERLCSK